MDVGRRQRRADSAFRLFSSSGFAPMNVPSIFGWFAIIIISASSAVACEAPCNLSPQPICVADDEPPSWIFRRSTYTHDPNTGARVAQYQRLPAIEPLEDERLVTSRYHRIQTNLRGTNGSSEQYYDVQAWGNGRGGIDAEWERFHNAWKESYLQGGFYNQQGQGFGNGYPGQFGNGFGGPGFSYGYPGYGFPGNGFPGIGNGGPWGNHGAWHGGNGNGHHGDDDHFNGHGHAGDWD
jgi:hypothetical protein